MSRDLLLIWCLTFLTRLSTLQSNRSYPTQEGTGEMCQIVQDVDILRFYFN
jgi:hypothetical protein